MSDGRKLSTPSTSRTLPARRGAPSTNSLAGLDAPFACARSRKSPWPRNLCNTGNIRSGTTSPPGSSTRSCSTYGRSQHLIVTVSRTLYATLRRLRPGNSLGSEFHPPGVYCPCRVRSQILVLGFPHFTHAPTQISKDLEKSTESCDL